MGNREENRRYNERHPGRVRDSNDRWKAANPKKMASYSSLYNRRLRSKVFDLLGRVCAECGFNDIRALQFDHTSGGGTQMRRSKGRTGIYRHALSNPGQYQVLCANCNWIKRIENNEDGGT